MHYLLRLFAFGCFLVTFSVTPHSAEARNCTSGCNQLEIACNFEARAIAEIEKADCVTDRMVCTETCEVGEGACVAGCEAAAAPCAAVCPDFERRSHQRRCFRHCNREVPKCKRACGRGEFRACDTDCRLERRGCVGAAVAPLKAARPVCEAANDTCVTACSAIPVSYTHLTLPTIDPV